MANPGKIHAYRRENDRIGVRNHVVILPVDDISNAACEAVASHIQGTMAIPHAYGRLQFGADLDLHFRTIIGTGANPNVSSVIIGARHLAQLEENLGALDVLASLSDEQKDEIDNLFA